jgi:hypothetical protein
MNEPDRAAFEELREMTRQFLEELTRNTNPGVRNIVINDAPSARLW